MRIELLSQQHEPSDHDKYYRPEKAGRVSWHVWLHVGSDRFKIDTGTTRENDARAVAARLAVALGLEVKA